jgi:GT2 family glycosyltransferase
MQSDSRITALIITYAPDRDVLKACIDSLKTQNPAPEILVVDNLAPGDPGHDIALSFKGADVDVLTVNRNIGFGGAINLAIKTVDTPYILISNFDIVYEPDYLQNSLARLESGADDIIGVAGKTLFYPPGTGSNWPGRGPGDPRPVSGRGTGGVIDNTGTLVNGLMLAYNRGVGQIDIGQYDVSDRPMGACFAAFLARLDAFMKPGKSQGDVGMLDTPFFMYYEDIDWCYRANLLGKKILYEPNAVAWHHHSLTTRDKGVFFKYRLIQRNLYRTIMKNMHFRTVIRLWWLHMRLHIRRARVEKEFGMVTAKILLETLLWTVHGLFARIPIQSRRKVSDTEIVNLSIGEEGHLDDITLRPRADWSNPLASLKRLQITHPDDPALELLPIIENLMENKNPENEVQARELAGRVCPNLVPLIGEILKSRD